MKRGILATREELESLRERITRRPFDAIHERLNRRCSLILETAPVTEAQWRSLYQQGAWGSALLAARTTQGRILDLLIAHHVEANSAYRDRAIEELKSLISWTFWVDPSHNHMPADLCTAEAAVAAVVGLDWLWEDLGDSDRLRIQEVIKTKAVEPYRQGVKQGVSWYNTYSNWNAVVNSGCGLAALALSDCDPSADEALRWARKGLEQFFNALGREGGWDEGTGYWAYSMRYILLLGEAMSRLADDQTIIHRRGMDVTGLFPIYFTPGGRPASFGDNPSVPLYGTFYLLVKHFALKEVTWWLDTYAFHRDVSTSGFSAAGLALLFRPVDAKTPKAPDLSRLKVYNEIGWAAMADAWPRPGLYVAAKTGDLSASHSQHDMNSIQVQVGGEMLLNDLGHPPFSGRYFSDARGQFYEVQARAHNTVVVARRDHRIDAQGRIIESASDDAYRYVAMDSAGACGEDVEFIRHVVMVVNPRTLAGETIVVLDEIASGAPERVDLFWHTPGTIDLDSSRLAGTISGRLAAVRFALASTVKAKAAGESHPLDRGRTDHVLHLWAGVVGREYFASVFTRRPEDATLELKNGKRGLELTFGNLELTFKSAKRYLRLEQVRRG